MNTGERDAWLLLGLTPGLGATLTRRCVESLGSAEAVIGATADRLAMIEGISVRAAGNIKREMDSKAGSDAIKSEIELVERWGVELLSVMEPDYPVHLKRIPDPPAVLYVRGKIEEIDRLAIGVVGSRKCTHYGREQASRFAAGCAQAGLTIVSGGAYGVDISAHESAVRVKGRTLAVIGSGLANPYPGEHRAFFDRLAAEGCGAVISELPMKAPPTPKNFPSRNRIISGLSLGILVVEAAERSGALITARMCVEDHNREVMALPGPVDSPMSAGCHKIIREGWAALVTNVNDVLDALRETGGELQKAGVVELKMSDEVPEPDLFADLQSASQKKILAALDGPMTLDQLAIATTLPIQTLQSDLMMMQIRGYLRKEGSVFVKR